MNTKPQFLDTQETSRHLKEQGIPVEPSTLEAWRTRGGGPRYHKFGRLVRYSDVDLDKWIAGRATENTAA